MDVGDCLSRVALNKALMCITVLLFCSRRLHPHLEMHLWSQRVQLQVPVDVIVFAKLQLFPSWLLLWLLYFMTKSGILLHRRRQCQESGGNSEEEVEGRCKLGTHDYTTRDGCKWDWV